MIRVDETYDEARAVVVDDLGIVVDEWSVDEDGRLQLSLGDEIVAVFNVGAWRSISVR